MFRLAIKLFLAYLYIVLLKTSEITKKCDNQTWIVTAYRFASKRYRYTDLFTVTFTGKTGNVH